MMTTTQSADEMIRAALHPTGGGPPTDPRAQLAHYQALIQVALPLSSTEAALEILGAGAKLARQVKEHSRALSYHREMLSLRGRAGAIPESYLLLWTEIATDLQLRISEGI